MILIADSGSTKTHWEFVNNGKTSSVFTEGINPFYKNTEQITTELRAELLPHINSKPEKIFFYGAGISQPDKVAIVKEALLALFPSAEAEVEHDLLGAARATCGKSPGIACILGTGSNSCLYGGEDIVDNIPSLGFTLGDEGSGGQLGRKLLQAYYYREMPGDLKELMDAKFDMKKDKVLNAVYNSDMPNQVVASYAEFLTYCKDHPYITKLIRDCFREFLERHVCKYNQNNRIPVHFIGSIAFYNREILKGVMENIGLKIGVILKSPMDGLVKYHSQI